MVVVSSREFRANQRKYFDLARTNDVVITSRSHGSFRLVPVMEDDTLIDRATLDAKKDLKELKKKDVSLCGWRPLSIGDVFTVTGRQSA